ncbi:MAG: hypothetical protein EOP54_23060, partial [Sphingobacteriales bacterium]
MHCMRMRKIFWVMLLLVTVSAGFAQKPQVLITKQKVKTPFGKIAITSPDFKKCEKLLITDFGAVQGDKEKTWELLQLINPVNHGNSPETIGVYKTEPYVIAADVYGVKEHKSRGGWTWYTGSAGWMYQLILEWFIGMKRKGDQLGFNPCIPAAWPSVKIKYRYM